MSVTCPFCDSDDVTTIEVKEQFPVPFVGQILVCHPVYRCNNCEEEGDFDHSLDKELDKRLDKENLASAPKLMNDLVSQGITMTYFEKALRLPFRTTARWKRGEISHSALALLRLIRFSPELLEVADENFSPATCRNYHMSRPMEFFAAHTINPSLTVSFADCTLVATYEGGIPQHVPPKNIATGSTFPVVWEQAR